MAGGTSTVRNARPITTRGATRHTWADLKTFMHAPVNTVSREALITRRVLSDLAIAAAHAGYALRTFTPDVDRDGVDIVLSDGDCTVPVQLKTSMYPIRQNHYFKGIHAGLLRPPLLVAEHIGFEPTQFGSGQAGALVVVAVDIVPPGRADDGLPRLDLQYWICSAEILVALQMGWVPCATSVAQRSAAKLLRNLQQSSSHARVTVCGRGLIPATSPGALLTLLGLHSYGQHQRHYGWQTHLCSALYGPLGEARSRSEKLSEVLPATSEQNAETAARETAAERVVQALGSCVRWREPPTDG